jgi:hypothetical protein
MDSAIAGTAGGELVKGWAKMSQTGGTLTLQDSDNVSSVVDNGTGDITVNWDTDFGSAFYACVMTSGNDTEAAGMQQVQNYAAGSLTLRTYSSSGGSSDRDNISVIATGDQ